MYVVYTIVHRLVRAGRTSQALLTAYVLIAYAFLQCDFFLDVIAKSITISFNRFVTHAFVLRISMHCSIKTILTRDVKFQMSKQN